MLLPNLILLIDVTFSTPTPVNINYRGALYSPSTRKAAIAMPLKRWLIISAGTVACMAILMALRFSHLSFLIVFVVIAVSAALYHAD